MPIFKTREGAMKRQAFEQAHGKFKWSITKLDNGTYEVKKTKELKPEKQVEKPDLSNPQVSAQEKVKNMVGAASDFV